MYYYTRYDIAKSMHVLNHFITIQKRFKGVPKGETMFEFKMLSKSSECLWGLSQWFRGEPQYGTMSVGNLKG